MSKQTVGHFTEFVGRRIANRRKQKKISPEDMARKIGVSVTVLDHMEHGYCHINLEQLILCSHYLSPTEDLLGLPHCSDGEMKAFIDARVNAMSEEELRNWKANTEAMATEQHRLFILDFDASEEPQ
jgi:transcriptional regulator with XRE-family HTH domain